MPGRLETFHAGEAHMRDAMAIPPGENPTAVGLPAPYAARVEASALLAVGTLDGAGRPWTTVWCGARGLAARVAEDVLGVSSVVDGRHDPVYAALWGEQQDQQQQLEQQQEEGGIKEKKDARGGSVSSGVVRPNGGRGKMVGALAIDLDSRDRMKLAGLVVAASAERMGGHDDDADGDAVGDDGGDGDGGAVDVQAAVLITESIGNCPKYLNKKAITRRSPGAARLAGARLPLTDGALALLGRADMFFLSTTTGDTMDTNYRGGVPGFVRVVRNDEGGVTLAYPEYSGNRLYQSLGNLIVDARIGITFPDFATADVLYLTGTATVLVGEAAASSLLPRSNLAVRIDVTDARLVEGGLPFRGAEGEPSPYNPPLRYLVSERAATAPSRTGATTTTTLMATLVGREVLTPTVAIFTFELSSSGSDSSDGGGGGGGKEATWQAGQHVTLDFRPELYTGYSHMYDSDPQRINDDFVRTFTVSSEPPPPPPPPTKTKTAGAGTGKRRRFEITARRHGPATGLLWRQNLRAPLELRVLGFGGEASFRLPLTAASAVDSSSSISGGIPHEVVYVAGGVGVTPLLAQARGEGGALLTSSSSSPRLRVLWTLRGEDLGLAARVFADVPGLAGATTLFVTGPVEAEADVETLGRLREEMKATAAAAATGAGGGGGVVETRRMREADVAALRGGGRAFYLCAGPGLRRRLEEWLEGERTAWEDFGY
ncbi:hypothetical protein JDV02_004570 [Purpureocillium takamizusanense]|uniref:FAD-binding FR-type domain-containing protein n=1 Tax=Purpureocillium takamizusanense TaxID=2060973 RepID=A0A9Q8QCS5_9HYPO|nr:uncharacterized protein JDV02_004570 [Purpureocillium takamizusanense]UNI18294.1 hypothetical protein JDV02_004570 [Purpureocillium takamizusanense]